MIELVNYGYEFDSGPKRMVAAGDTKNIYYCNLSNKTFRTYSIGNWTYSEQTLKNLRGKLKGRVSLHLGYIVDVTWTDTRVNIVGNLRTKSYSRKFTRASVNVFDPWPMRKGN